MVGRDRGFKTRTEENGSFFCHGRCLRSRYRRGKKGRAEHERRKVERAHTDNWLVKGPREPVDGVEQEFPTRAPLVLAFRSKPLRAYDLTDRCVLPLATVTQLRMELTYAIYGPGTTLDSHRENADKAESSLQPYKRYEPCVQGLYQGHFLSSTRDEREILARF